MATTTEKPMQFQAEVQQLLNIVINSLYTDKEIFVRELVSNASDALEKLRHHQLTGEDVFQDDLDLDINITTDEEANTITIQDYGIGMTREELMENIGTIAHSGSKKFLQALKEEEKKESALIGQFGVGFYSAFMVAEEVKVYTHSWQKDSEHLVWSSDGKSNYSIEESPDQKRGCRIVIKLKEGCEEFAKKERIEGILKKYSNFVQFPILLNEERINTVEAIWLKNKSEVTDEEYTEFYKFAAGAWDEPRHRFHFSADAPIEINALLFVPQENREKFGMGQMDPNVSLYCRKVLIDDAPKGLLPEWLRFLSGVIDSADLPLNISRESMQDSALVQKLNRVVTKRFLKFLDKEAKNESEKYLEFFKEFSRFIKEGIATDFEHREQLAKLLRFESSMTEPGEVTSLDEYITRAKEEQKEIYYLIGQDRESIEAGPYLEAFKARGIEVVYFFEAIDDYVLNSLREYNEKTLKSASRSDIELDESEHETQGEPLTEEEATALCDFLQNHWGDSVQKVSVGNRLVDSPVAALNPDEGMNPQMREMMKMMNQEGDLGAAKVDVEINPRHPVIRNLSSKVEGNPELAGLAASHLLDNALLQAGLLDNQKDLVRRGYEVLEKALS